MCIQEFNIICVHQGQVVGPFDCRSRGIGSIPDRDVESLYTFLPNMPQSNQLYIKWVPVVKTTGSSHDACKDLEWPFRSLDVSGNQITCCVISGKLENK